MKAMRESGNDVGVGWKLEVELVMTIDGVEAPVNPSPSAATRADFLSWHHHPPGIFTTAVYDYLPMLIL